MSELVIGIILAQLVDYVNISYLLITLRFFQTKIPK